MTMNIKLFELRDRGTRIPIFAFSTKADWENSRESWLLRDAGFGPANPLVIIGELNCASPRHSHCTFDYTEHWDRTFTCAHRYLEEHWDQIESGAVIDVEYLMGETDAPTQSDMP